MVAIVILLSTRGTAGSDIWFTCSAERPMVRSYHPRDYGWTPLKAESLLVDATMPSHPLQRWLSNWRSCLRYGPVGLGHSIVGTMALRAELSRGGGYPCPRPGARPYELCVTQGKGVADPFVNDSSTGRGFVLGRAATKLRSIENYPLTGGSIGQRPVWSSPGLARPKFFGQGSLSLRIIGNFFQSLSCDTLLQIWDTCASCRWLRIAGWDCTPRGLAAAEIREWWVMSLG